MKPLPAPEQHRLRAAEGWLELSNPREALAELESISPEWCGHSDVLNMRSQIARTAKEWETCFEVARKFSQSAPQDPRAWTSLAQTFYHASRLQEAYNLAVSKITSFPKYWPLYYDAACYACLTGRLNQARQFLQLATALGDEDEIKSLASHDPDLEALRKEL